MLSLQKFSNNNSIYLQVTFSPCLTEFSSLYAWSRGFRSLSQNSIDFFDYDLYHFTLIFIILLSFYIYLYHLLLFISFISIIFIILLYYIIILFIYIILLSFAFSFRHLDCMEKKFTIGNVQWYLPIYHWT